MIRYSAEYWDKIRDSRKHDWKEKEPAHRLDVQIPDVTEVAIAVMNCPNAHVAAGLIDAYADAKAAQIRLDAVAAGANP